MHNINFTEIHEGHYCQKATYYLSKVSILNENLYKNKWKAWFNISGFRSYCSSRASIKASNWWSMLSVFSLNVLIWSLRNSNCLLISSLNDSLLVTWICLWNEIKNSFHNLQKAYLLMNLKLSACTLILTTAVLHITSPLFAGINPAATFLCVIP